MRNNKQGFTLVELLVVLLIIAILAAVAAPLYLANAQRARASEAVATMSLIRQGERDWNLNNSAFYPVAQDVTTAIGSGNIQLPPPNGTSMSVGTTQYFTNGNYYVRLPGGIPAAPPAGNSGLFINPPVQGFLISVTGVNSFLCTAAAPAASESCAVRAGQVSTQRLEMDNSGRIFVSYNGGTNWEAY